MNLCRVFGGDFFLRKENIASSSEQQEQVVHINWKYFCTRWLLLFISFGLELKVKKCQVMSYSYIFCQNVI